MNDIRDERPCLFCCHCDGGPREGPVQAEVAVLRCTCTRFSSPTCSSSPSVARRGLLCCSGTRIFELAMAMRVFEIHHANPGRSEEWYYDNIIGVGKLPQNLRIAKAALATPVFPTTGTFTRRFKRFEDGEDFWDFGSQGKGGMNVLLKWASEEGALSYLQHAPLL